jgi:hypothetical protein
MTSITRKALVALAASALTASVASAQATVTFSTAGMFGGSCAAASCTFGGFTLSFLNQASTAYLAPSVVDLGTFVTTAASGSEPSTPAPGGATFELIITQTSPTGGTAAVMGSIAGSLAYNPSQSSLVFTPTNGTTFTIGDVRYELIIDNVSGGVNIAAPIGTQNPNNTIFKANVVVPEPATVVLMGSGLAALGFFGARRKKS